MKIYKFDCDSCGSKQYIKTKSGYKCKYCGSVQDVISVDSEKKPEQTTNQVAGGIVRTHQDSGYAAHFRREAKHSLILLIVCIFAGVYGVHRFMQHKIISGILFLLTGGLFGIGWFIDVVKLGIKLAVECKTAGGA